MHARGHVQALPPGPAAHQREGLRDPRQPRRLFRRPLLAVPHRHPHDGHAVTDHHRRHTIDDNDQRDFDREPVHFHDVRADDERPFVPKQHDEPTHVDRLAARAIRNLTKHGDDHPDIPRHLDAIAEALAPRLIRIDNLRAIRAECDAERT